MRNIALILSLLVVIVPSLLLRGSQAQPRNQDDKKAISRDKASKNDLISSDCRLMRGDKLATTLNFPIGFFDKETVFVVGYLLNATAQVAYVTGGVTVSWDDSERKAEFKSGLIPPNRREGLPFLAQLNGPIDAQLDITHLSLKFRVLEVRFK